MALDAPTILIIDDSFEDRLMYRRYLLKERHCSYVFLEADSGETGLQCIEQSVCDLILLDFLLPDCDGLEVIAKLQQMELASIPVIMLTGMGDETIALQATKQGVQDYLIKSQVTPEVLQVTIRNALGRARLQSQLAESEKRQNLISEIALKIRETLNLYQIVHESVI